tara:strand:+ start:27 stop:749 length:723 start_codon:yes stop_codon:yes gene_type:complete
MDSVITKNTFLNSPNPSVPVPISSVKPSITNVNSGSIRPPSTKLSSPQISLPKFSSNTATNKASIISTRLSDIKDSVSTKTNGLNYFTIIRYIFIIIIILFLGYNLFAYLGGGPLIGLGGLFKRDYDQSDKKNKLTQKNLNKGGVNKLNKALNKKKILRNKIDDNTNSSGRALKEPSVDAIPLPDESDSKTQRGTMKPGFCYVGEDRGIRSCVKVNESDMCMSGDIFPTQAICVNPSLRE